MKVRINHHYPTSRLHSLSLSLSRSRHVRFLRIEQGSVFCPVGFNQRAFSPSRTSGVRPAAQEQLQSLHLLLRRDGDWQQRIQGREPETEQLERSRDVFSRSFREEDDEEALKWAALEKLPTYSCIRKGILVGAEGEHRGIEIKDLGNQERKTLLERLVRIADEDNERFLLKLRNRIDRVGIDLPTIEVRFEDLNITAEAHVGGERCLPSSTPVFAGGGGRAPHPVQQEEAISILHNLRGIIKPFFTVLQDDSAFGSPGLWKTSFLLALAGKRGSDVKVSGKITYNGHGLDEFVPERTSAYVSQYDIHIGEMTVRETLDFSARCQGVGTPYEILSELSRREKAANIKPDPDIDVFTKAIAMEGQQASVVTDYILKILGLDICADTMVGDEMVRGISGAKGSASPQMMVGPARALFMDEISTGLDSSTTFQIVKALRQSIHILGGTALISLLQPAPETYDLFDDIILLSDGQIVYQGPREDVLEFFEFMGFKCPERKGIADFLQEVTSRKDQGQYWARHGEPYRFVPVNDFTDSFKAFHVGKDVTKELAVPFDRTKSHPAALTTSKYGVSKKELLKACIERELLLMKRNSFVYVFRSFQILLLSFLTTTVFLRTKMPRDSVADGNIFMGALFFSVIIVMFNGLAELAMTDLLFYPAWAYALPSWVLKIPITFVEVAVWVFVTYYAIGFDPRAARLFKQYLLLLLTSQMANGLFRLVAALGGNMVIANTFGSFAVLVVMVLGGFVLAREMVEMGMWVSPMMYAQYGVFINEFLGKSWSKVSDSPGTTEPLGILVLRSRSVFTEAKWYWIGVGALAGYMLLFNVFITLALQYLNPLEKGQAAVSEESLNEKHENLTVQSLELSSRGERFRGNQPFERDGSSFCPLSMEFEDIRYSVDMPAIGASEGVSGSFRPGVLTALMGVSGAGKTTLMDVLSGRKTEDISKEHNHIRVPKKQETFARISGYCEQNDIHSPHVTVGESLLYSAWLRLPAEVDSNTRKMFCEEIMELVELTQLREAHVGLPGVSGLSTEQRKRLTIAVELVSNPSIIFMDEPTSGLDARAAAIVMRTVRNTVDTGRTVVCTIHQPSIDIFEAFDELFLMKRGGEEIYIGPLGRQSCELIKRLQPATWMLEMTTLGQEDVLGVSFSELYKNSELYQRNKSLIRELSVPAPGSSDLDFPTQYSRTFFTQCMACLWKQHLSLFFTTVIALLFGTIFWGLGSRREKKQDLFNALGSMYCAVLFIGIQNAQTVQPVVSVERTVFYREIAAGMYSALPYAFGQCGALLCSPRSIGYLAGGDRAAIHPTSGRGVRAHRLCNDRVRVDGGQVLLVHLLHVLHLPLLHLIRMMAVGMTPNHNVAAIVSGAFYGIWNLFSGFLIPRPMVQLGLPMAWTLYGLIASQFGDISAIVEDEPVDVFLKNYFGFEHDFLWAVATAVVAFSVLFASIFAFSIKTLNFQKR
ncbi:unnamed protein product [Spirodela intermedia]|uniref:ABC transporter domain-containing protein n=1 Tax=Spirodela intermedia TaxID=51605 RepID=A0A7I8JL18_SPIIN|nr:unnamed protein product [Spirodela intermedia]CAA6670849.1 unnamed protein product [Spirodela intermedia]